MTRLTRNGDPRAAQTLKAQLRLRQMILDGELGAGERVPELMLVKRTGVSRTPIRAALLGLAEEGLLERSDSGGFVVRAFDETEVYDAIDVRGTLEGAAARRAAQRHPSHSELTELRDCVGAMDAIVKRRRRWGRSSSADFVRLNERYHSLLVAIGAEPRVDACHRAHCGSAVRLAKRLRNSAISACRRASNANPLPAAASRDPGGRGGGCEQRGPKKWPASIRISPSAICWRPRSAKRRCARLRAVISFVCDWRRCSVSSLFTARIAACAP